MTADGDTMTPDTEALEKARWTFAWLLRTGGYFGMPLEAAIEAYPAAFPEGAAALIAQVERLLAIEAAARDVADLLKWVNADSHIIASALRAYRSSEYARAFVDLEFAARKPLAKLLAALVAPGVK